MKLEEFWNYVDKSGDCWVWTRAKDSKGYGLLRVRGINVRAHRQAWELTHGPIPSGRGYHGRVVAHRCDNRLCVRPDHLFLTNQRGNLIDCKRKGRLNKAFGADAGRAELDDRDVIEIREAAASGENRAALAARFGVCSQTIVDIVVGKTWAHLPLTTRTVAKAPRTYNDKPNRTSFQKGSKGNPGPKPERRTADYDAIRALLASGASYREIARKTGTTHTTVRRVAGG